MSKKELSELQIKFLEALFGEAKGDLNEARRLAGYADTTKITDIVKGIKEEIIEQANMTLAVNSPKAAIELVGLMIDPSQASAVTKLKAVQEILNRVGVTDKTKSGDVNLEVPKGGLFIMPAKGAGEVGKEIETEVE
jgi:hypothetical protein